MTHYTQREYTVRFLTPAFVGNAEQNGEWRTPPFKALLRQWWRVAYVAGRKPTASLVADMRRAEGLLFGNAWLDHLENGKKVTDHSKSLVRIRLAALPDQNPVAWSEGSQKGVAPLSPGLDTSYSWFGLIKRKDRHTKASLPDRTGVLAGTKESERILRLAAPEAHIAEILQSLRLINAFGQVGSRARTGWGAVHLIGDDLPLPPQALRAYSRNGFECLNEEWAHAIGSDAQGLWMWESKQSYRDWSSLLTRLSPLRRDIRVALKGAINLRPLLGFADGTNRMPSPLRWRAIPGDDKDSLRIRVFALPHRIPDAGGRNTSLNRHAESAWETVVQQLDHSGLQRSAEGFKA